MEYTSSTYGDHIASVYDERHRFLDPTPAVDLLVELAGPGPVMELGVGTGRLALPLSQRDIEVHGIDASEAMVNRLASKPGGDTIKVFMGDMADVDAAGPYSLVFVAFNTFFGILTQEDQVRCFANVARRLTGGGRFVLECFVPDPGRFDRGQRVAATFVEADRAELDVTRLDLAAQRTYSAHIIISDEGVQFYPVQIRWAWPSELDLMAQMAGLELEQRWGGWRKEPFGSTSDGHVSVYRKQ